MTEVCKLAEMPLVKSRVLFQDIILKPSEWTQEKYRQTYS